MTQSPPWTVLRLIEWTKDYLAKAKVEEARLSAEILLAKVLGCERVGLYVQFMRVVAPEQLTEYKELIKRAAGHEPIAYLTGQREFYSLAFKVTPDVLIPRPETELLVDHALEACKRAGGSARMWDVCTGSGCVAVAAAAFAPKLAVLATDISPAALAVAGENVKKHKLEGRVALAQADLLSLPAEHAAMAPFQIITANPPYVSDADARVLPAVVKHEPDIALRAGPHGLDLIRRIVADAPAALDAGGTLAMEFGFGQAEDVSQLLTAAGQYEDIRILKDQAGIERTVVARRK